MTSVWQQEQLDIRAGRDFNILPLSVSRLLAYRECPAYYRRVYLDGEARRVSPAMLLGSALHEYAAGRLTRIENERIPLIPAELTAEYEELREVFDRIDWDFENLVEAEYDRFLQWPLPDGRQVQFQARIDALYVYDEEAVVTDLKSGRWVAGGEEEASKDLQLQVYALFAHHAYPFVKQVRAQQAQLRYGGRVVGATFTPGHLERFEQVLRAECEMVAADESFKPNPACSVCPVGTHEMPNVGVVVAPDGRKLQARAPESAEEALQLAVAAHFASRLNDACREALKPWVDENGPVQVGDKMLGYFPLTKRVIKDREAFGIELRRLGYDPSFFVGLSQVDTLLRSHPTLMALIENEVGPTLAWRKV